MIAKPKRKNDIVVSEYDQTWYGRFYRWMNWDMTEDMIVDASPETCIAHIQPDKVSKYYQIVARDRSIPSYYYRVKTQTEKYPYWFKLELSSTSLSRGSSSYMGHVFASIAPYGDDDQQSLITLRSYPHGFFFIIGVIVGIIVMAVGYLDSPAVPPVPEAYHTPFILTLFLMFFGYAMVSWRYLFVTRRKALNIVTDHFVSLSRYGPTQKDKRNSSRLEWPIILPFDDEITIEEQADERKTQER